MELLESNHKLISSFVQSKGILALINCTTSDLSTLSQQIEPQSAKAKFAKRFRAILKSDYSKRLLVDETRRLFSRFLKEWTQTTAQWVLAKRSSDLHSQSFSNTLSTDSSVLNAQLQETLDRAQSAEHLSKSHPFIPVKVGLHPLVMVPESSSGKQTASVFKVLSGKQMAGELASYFLGLFSRVDFFHSVVPSYCWVNQSGSSTRTMGILSTFHDQCHTVFEIFCSQSKGLQALQRLPEEFVQGICLMHLLRGSEDAHMKNTLIQTTTDPYSGEEVVTRIHEIDGEHIMSSSEPQSDRFGSKSVASMRIWWMGLPQAAKPLSPAMLSLVLSWSTEKLLELHAHIGLYPQEKVDAQVWRLDLMREMARRALLERQPLTAREIFAKLIYDHPTLAILSKTGCDPIQMYNSVGSLSTEEASLETPSATPVPLDSPAREAM